MKKYIKILFRDKKLEPVFLSKEKWESILDDPRTLCKYTLDSETEWTGRTINKSEVIGSEPDESYTKNAAEEGFDLYKHIPSNTVKKFNRGTLLPPDFGRDYQKL